MASEPGEESQASNITRRGVLQAASATGVIGFGTSVGSAAETSEIEASDIMFAELGVSFDHSLDVAQDDQYDPYEFYQVNEDEIRFSGIEKPDLETFQANDSVVRYDDFHGLPTQFTRREYSAMGSELNERLRLAGGILLSEPIPTPAIRVERDSKEVSVAAAANEARVATGTSETISAGSANLATRNGQSVKPTIEITVKNHGTLDVLVDQIVGGE